MTATTPVSFDVKLGAGSVNTYIGLLALQTDETTEHDFNQMLPDNSGIMFYTTRIRCFNPITPENQLKMAPQLQAGSELLLPDLPVSAIAFSCTSATAIIGYDNVARLIRAGRPEDSGDKLAVITPATAAIAAFEAFGIRKLAMLTPYNDEVNQQLIQAYEQGGDLEVTKLCSLFVASDVDIARITHDSIKQGAREAYEAGAEAVFLSCTAMPAIGVIEALEQELGVPVFSSNQCMFWHCLKAAGYHQPIHGYGRLLAEKR